MRPTTTALFAIPLLALAACHPANDQAQPGTANGTTDTSNAGGAPGTATDANGIAQPNGTPRQALPAQGDAASATGVPASVAASSAR